MSIDQIRDFCRGILDACDQADPNEPSIYPELVLLGCITNWETIPQQTQQNIAKPLYSGHYAIIRQPTGASRSTKTKSITKTITKSTGAPRSTKIKPRTENTITIDETLLKEFHNTKVVTAAIGQFPGTWLEFDFGNESNDNWSGADVSCLVAAKNRLETPALRVCGSGICSTIKADGTGDNAYAKGLEAEDGIGTLHLVKSALVSQLASNDEYGPGF
ncbi:hypothetical protein QQZ08_011829 [Neonectria magnoliae]|uniref:Uncharacterized protein n=1 Tax=Neonectria magnoliae TaxID=2732573 RepID=A0ABR1H8L2_9HYPO